MVTEHSKMWFDSVMDFSHDTTLPQGRQKAPQTFRFAQLLARPACLHAMHTPMWGRINGSRRRRAEVKGRRSSQVSGCQDGEGGERRKKHHPIPVSHSHAPRSIFLEMPLPSEPANSNFSHPNVTSHPRPHSTYASRIKAGDGEMRLGKVLKNGR